MRMQAAAGPRRLPANVRCVESPSPWCKYRAIRVTIVVPARSWIPVMNPKNVQGPQPVRPVGIRGRRVRWVALRPSVRLAARRMIVT